MESNKLTLKKLHQMWVVYLDWGKGTLVKTDAAKRYGVSPRSIGRWIKFIDNALLRSSSSNLDDLEEYFGLWEATQKQQNPEDIAPKLWAAYKDVLNDQALTALRDVICEQWSFVSGEDSDCLGNAFWWDKTPNGDDFWGCVEDGYYNICDNTPEPTGYFPPDFYVNIQAIILPKTIVIVRGGVPQQIDHQHKFFNKIKTLLESNINEGAIPNSKLDEVYNLIDLKNHIEKYTNGAVKVTENGVTFNDKIIDNRLSERLITAVIAPNGAEFDTLESLTNFMIKLDENPSYKIRDRLYDFLANAEVKIANNGNVIGYRAVTSDYKDKYTNTFDNSVGASPEMERRNVDDGEGDCMCGLHLGSWTYIDRSYYQDGDRVIMCEADPKDWVSLPLNYQTQKGRVCKFTVLADVTDKFLAEKR